MSVYSMGISHHLRNKLPWCHSVSATFHANHSVKFRRFQILFSFEGKIVRKSSIYTHDFISGNSRTGRVIGEPEYCGIRENVNLTSSSNVMTIEFLTDETRQYYGFIASYASGKNL